MHAQILLITETQDAEQAQRAAEDYMEGYVGNRVDYFNILEESTKPAKEYETEIRKLTNKETRQREIDESWNNLAAAHEIAVEKKDQYSCWSKLAYHARKYSELINDEFTENIDIRDIDNGTSEIEEDKDLDGWFAIRVDYHY